LTTTPIVPTPFFFPHTIVSDFVIWNTCWADAQLRPPHMQIKVS
jgi:hypothetical protein